MASIERKYTVIHYFSCNGIVHGPLARLNKLLPHLLCVCCWLVPIRVLWALERELDVENRCTDPLGVRHTRGVVKNKQFSALNLYNFKLGYLRDARLMQINKIAAYYKMHAWLRINFLLPGFMDRGFLTNNKR